MRPAPIPDDRIPPGAKRIVVGPPGNDLDSQVAPVEAVIYTSEFHPGKMISVRCILEENDLDNLHRGEAVWITFMDTIVPFDVRVAP